MITNYGVNLCRLSCRLSNKAYFLSFRIDTDNDVLNFISSEDDIIIIVTLSACNGCSGALLIQLIKAIGVTPCTIGNLELVCTCGYVLKDDTITY